ncbi:putative aspartate aminotransferase 2 [Candidatus Methanoplasma termitum]|uniref:Aminotransferase n=1 Tax=Candidatus Methanoplasma termitum TaxID=1577791 RepID=A0A0A7LFX7_9ARCH|nr:pyridoxal phosphate-dependent aminotransferase [Candidatus Methanoplasma termitum]AIZ57172.1 putative aspartate aminotransferase 2 [Candidatus Methanoplasma termitum]MCL2333617.1 pyridoxal phosphate-dependent aminotransferase [Candidatus Methanoplasma sp.]
MVSKRLMGVPASGTIALSNLVSFMKSKGADIISFSMGEPDFTTPQNIIDACKKSLDDGFTHYTNSAGIPELRKAISTKAFYENNIHCTAKNVLVTPTKHAIFMAALAFLDRGDEVIMEDPNWVTYDAAIRIAEAKPKFVTTSFDDGFVVDPAKIEDSITPKTKMIILNSPSNPTGNVIPRETLEEIANIAIENDLMVLSDEIYENIIYEGNHFSIASIPEMFDRTITVSGLSKTYAMTGWRLGWAIASEENLKALDIIQTHSISCCTSFAQPAAVEAITGPQNEKEAMVKEFRKRRDLAVDLIREIRGLEVNVPQGAFYLFPRYAPKIRSEIMCTKMLEEAQVAVTPGSAFGPNGEGCFRLSYATSEEQIIEGLSRIKKFMFTL